MTYRDALSQLTDDPHELTAAEWELISLARQHRRDPGKILSSAKMWVARGFNVLDAIRAAAGE